MQKQPAKYQISGDEEEEKLKSSRSESEVGGRGTLPSSAKVVRGKWERARSAKMETHFIAVELRAMYLHGQKNSLFSLSDTCRGYYHSVSLRSARQSVSLYPRFSTVPRSTFFLFA